MTTPVLKEQFDTFSKEAFRLESLAYYNVKGDLAEFKRFAEGEPLPSWNDRPWIQRLREKTSAGLMYKRVRVLPVQLTAYLRFVIEWGYPAMADAGEEILVLEEGSPVYERAINEGDYWLFDETTPFRMEYDEQGTFTGSRYTDDAEHLTLLKRDLVDQSIPLRDYLVRFRSTTLSVPPRFQ